MPDTLSAPMRQFLQWVTERPRLYADVMDEWRSSCPRLAVWEDAYIEGYVRLEGGPAGTVVLTPAGQTALAVAVREPAGPRLIRGAHHPVMGVDQAGSLRPVGD